MLQGGPQVGQMNDKRIPSLVICHDGLRSLSFSLTAQSPHWRSGAEGAARAWTALAKTVLVSGSDESGS